MAESDQAIRDIVAQLVASPQQAQEAPSMGATVSMPVPARSNFAIGSFPPAAFTPPTGQSNRDAAYYALNLSPQEQALYGRHLTNLTGPGGVDNPDGSRSTLYQSVQEHGGKFYSVPTVWDGQREVEPYTRQDGSTMDVPNATAMGNIARTGWDTFPSYATPDEADSRYDQMHGYMERDTADYMKQRSTP